MQQEQLVVARANHRFNVAPFNLSDLEAVLGLHLTIVTLAIRVGVSFVTEQETRSLEDCVDLMEASLSYDDGSGWEAAYRDFISTITKHTGERIKALSLQLHDDIQRYRANLPHKVPQIWCTGGREFRQIAEAVASRDDRTMLPSKS